MQPASASLLRLSNALLFRIGKMSTSLARVGGCIIGSSVILVVWLIMPSGYMTSFYHLVDGSKLVDICLKVEVTPVSIVMDYSLKLLSEKSGTQKLGLEVEERYFNLVHVY